MYTDVFGSKTVGATTNSQSIFTISSDLQLYWPSDSSNSTNPMNSFVFLNVNAGGLILTLPDATLSSNGSASTFVNFGPNAITIHDFLGNTVGILEDSATVTLELHSNAHQGGSGTWVTFSNPTGGAVITGLDATAPARGFTITGVPITGGSGDIVFTLANTLASLETIGTGATTGFLTKLSDGTLALRSITTSDSNINVLNPTGVAGNVVLSLNANVTGLTSLTVGNLTISGNEINSIGTDSLYLNTTGQFVQTDSSYAITDPISGLSTGFYVNMDLSLLQVGDIFYKLPTIIPVRNDSIMVSSRINSLQASFNPSSYVKSGVAAAWVIFNGVSFSYSGNNIASFVQNVGTGTFTVTFSIGFTSTNIGCTGNSNAIDGSTIGLMSFQIISSTVVNIFTKNSGVPANYAYNFASFFGILA